MYGMHLVSSKILEVISHGAQEPKKRNHTPRNRNPDLHVEKYDDYEDHSLAVMPACDQAWCWLVACPGPDAQMLSFRTKQVGLLGGCLVSTRAA
jgi:hypothetical protein